MKILVVDDEFVSREKLSAILRHYGPCDAAPDGQTALTMIQDAYRSRAPYELVTMDLNMPDMSGHVVVQEMRHWAKENPQIANGFFATVLIITASKEIREVMESFEEGAEAYIVKPVTPENVAEAVAKIDGGHPYQAPNDTPAETVTPAAPVADGIGSHILPPSPSDLQPDEMAADYMADYLDSTRDKLSELEAAALDLDETDDVLATTNGIMRVLHSLKGEAGMVGLREVSDILHRTETAVKDHEDDPACAEFVLRIKDWMSLVVAYLQAPVESRQLEATQQAIASESEEPAAPVAKAKPGAEVKLILADHLDCGRVVTDFVQDYIDATTRRRKMLDDTIEQIQAAETGTAFVTPMIGILNALKGEAAMIGLRQVSKGINDAEDVFKELAETPKQCAPLLRRTSKWLASVVEHVGNMHGVTGR
ncbi:MAG: response regulator [Planctomycetes bacterium]|jgi:two-component system chemotaxis response regulator CheY|nr:response regulator [Phycisphaerae bacterium]NBB95678.1 response regulator [Planctomycetota bacterium]